MDLRPRLSPGLPLSVVLTHPIIRLQDQKTPFNPLTNQGEGYLCQSSAWIEGRQVIITGLPGC
jgi:hypothetical protein